MPVALIALSLVLTGVVAARGQDRPGNPPSVKESSGLSDVQPEKHTTLCDIARFLAGGTAGLAVHESGHLATGYLFRAEPGVKKVHFGPIPFFAITHRGDLSPRREFVVSSAGFWAQQLGSEILLTRRARLRDERAPLVKGMLAFNVLASVAYAGAAFAGAGPPERDTRSMAVASGVRESALGAILLGPAVLDAIRYYRPGTAWAAWASRALKVGMVLLVVRESRRQP